MHSFYKIEGKEYSIREDKKIKKIYMESFIKRREGKTGEK